MTAITGRPTAPHISMARRKSLRPKGVGSVTSSTRSACRATVTALQEVPGGASMITSPPLLPARGGTSCSSPSMSGGALASPMSSSPSRKSRSPARPRRRAPISRCPSTSASSGQASRQAPHPWQSSGKSSTRSGSVIIALKAHASWQAPQPLQVGWRRVGTGTDKRRELSHAGLR